MSKENKPDDEFSLSSMINKYQERIKKSIGDDFSEGRVRNIIEEAIDPDFMASFSAKQVLKGMAVNIIPTLIKILHEDQRDPVRMVVLETLASLGEKADFAYPLLIHLIDEDKNERIRSISIGALNNIIKENRYVIPILMRALKKDPGENVQRNAESCLIRRAKELGHETISDFVQVYYPASDYTEDYVATGANEILVALFVHEGNELFKDGKVSVEDLIKAEKYFRWAIQMESGKLKEWIAPRLMFIYDKLGYK